GARDTILPVGHGYEAHRRAVDSRLEVLESAGHFPQCDEPERVATLIERFVAGTEPAELDDADIQALVLRSR
ncbi:MAG TPA: alpha/beta hydrolase, partial [Mycobacteriales bacterium]|nr:alpha/beta hydrolase [Mycobacteriales bacterium]